MIWALGDSTGEAGLRVEDLAVREGHPSFTGKASQGTEPGESKEGAQPGAKRGFGKIWLRAWVGTLSHWLPGPLLPSTTPARVR